MASLHLYSRESQLLFYDVTIVHINPTKKNYMWHDVCACRLYKSFTNFFLLKKIAITLKCSLINKLTTKSSLKFSDMF